MHDSIKNGIRNLDITELAMPAFRIKLRTIDCRSRLKTAFNQLLNLPYKDKKRFSEYSLGMKQRLAVANATMNSPELLILDEPINGLDPEGIVDIRKLLIDLSRNHGTTILISSHILSEIQLIADDIGIIANGGYRQESCVNEMPSYTQYVANLNK